MQIEPSTKFESSNSADCLLSVKAYITCPPLVTFVACHPLPLFRLCCHSPLPSRAEMSSKIIWKKKKKQLKIIHDKSVRCFRNSTHHAACWTICIHAPIPVDTSVTTTESACHAWRFCILFKLAGLISDFHSEAVTRSIHEAGWMHTCQENDFAWERRESLLWDPFAECVWMMCCTDPSRTPAAELQQATLFQLINPLSRWWSPHRLARRRVE